MSYGFEIKNSSGIVLANSSDFNYGLVTAVSSASISPSSTTINFNNTGEIPLIFIRNNSSTWIACSAVTVTSATFYCFSATSGGSWNRRSTASSAVSIDYRIYTTFKNLGAVSGQNYGIQIFDANNNKTFDSNYDIPLIANIANLAIPTPSQYDAAPITRVVLPSGVGANPWFNINPIFGTDGALHGIHNSTVIDGSVNAGLFRCARVLSNYLEFSYGVPYTLGSFSGSTFGYAQGVSRTVYFISSQTSSALAATASFESGTTSCSYFSGSQSNCTTTATYRTDYTGGNTNAVTYSWSLINNTGGFSFSGGTTGQTASVTKTGTGTSTYTATLRCIVSQSGSTSATADVALSYTHTSVPPGSLVVSSGSQSNTGSTPAITVSSSGSIVSNLSQNLIDGKMAPTAAVASITFSTNGTISRTGTGSSGGNNWYSPTTTNIGNSYWIKLNVTSGTAWSSTNPSGMANNQIYPMSSARTFTWTRSNTGETTAAGTIQFYSDSGGTTPVGSGSGFSVSVTVEI